MHNLSKRPVCSYVNSQCIPSFSHRVVPLWTTIVDNSVDNVENSGFSTVIWPFSYPQPREIPMHIPVNIPLIPGIIKRLRQLAHWEKYH